MKILKAGGYIWADRSKLHKQGKVIADYAIYPLKTNYLPMAPIQDVPQAALDRPLNLDSYPNFWVDMDDCVDNQSNPVPTGTISDEMAAQAILTLIKFWKQ